MDVNVAQNFNQDDQLGDDSCATVNLTLDISSRMDQIIEVVAISSNNQWFVELIKEVLITLPFWSALLPAALLFVLFSLKASS